MSIKALSERTSFTLDDIKNTLDRPAHPHERTLHRPAHAHENTHDRPAHAWRLVRGLQPVPGTRINDASVSACGASGIPAVPEAYLRHT